MNKAHLIEIIKKGEGINVEFKKSKQKLNKELFDSVCSFLNRNGGHIFLGVDDDGTILGVDEDYIQGMLDSFVTSCNNPTKLDPPYFLSPEVIDIGNKKMIYIYVPESSQVHKTSGKIFDRNEDGDFDVSKNSAHISQMYLRKQSTYTENKIFPYATVDDLDANLLQRARIRAKNENNGSHPWFEMTDLELLKSAQLIKNDFQTGKTGITLAGILLFGKDETIMSVLPHHKTDAILRKV
ncbi:MAG: putative DNA binding domain-containing protein, partial [Flavobacteriales bacterium]|nr:putative DNA binding domain-containing protein [Flavobacteriales bacterium]